MKILVKVKGSGKSGFRGHAGRPGQRGGSAPKGTATFSHAGVHGTSAEGARKILSDGFDVSLAGSGGGYAGILGVGVYVDTSSDRGTAKLYGDVILGIRVKDNIKLYDATPKGKGVQSLYTSATNYGEPAKVTEHVKSLGFDGIKAEGQTVIFDPKDVQAYELGE